jgi:adenylylsulfate kinase
LAKKLRARGLDAAVLESDVLRKIFSDRPAYDDRDRDYFYGALAFAGHILTEHGIPVIFDATANRRSYRAQARQRIPRFIEVFVDTPLDVCIQRDPKGIYRMAQTGEASHVPGLQAAYEPPENAEVVIQGDKEDPEAAAGRIMEVLAL